MTPEGRAKALQNGATAADIEASVQSCTLCGACEPVCPEEIDLVGMTLDLRTPVGGHAPSVEALQPKWPSRRAPRRQFGERRASFPVLRCARNCPMRLSADRRPCSAVSPCEDDGEDIALALEAGVPVADHRRDRFLAGLRSAQRIVVDDGLWLRHLRAWLPVARLIGLGEALSSLEAVRKALRKSDLYVIEPRSYHGDYERLVKHYDRLRAERGCAFNLDLQRIAIPAAGQADWILKGLSVERIVVERLEDAAAVRASRRLPRGARGGIGGSLKAMQKAGTHALG